MAPAAPLQKPIINAKSQRKIISINFPCILSQIYFVTRLQGLFLFSLRSKRSIPFLLEAVHNAHTLLCMAKSTP